MQDPRKQKKGFDPAAFQAAAKAGQQQACGEQTEALRLGGWRSGGHAVQCASAVWICHALV